MKKLFILCLAPSLLWANERGVDIQKWVEVTPPKGYVLSLDLHHEKMCANIWSKQIKEFSKMNPHIKNPDLILVNQKIQVQDCRIEEKEVQAVAEIKEEKPSKSKDDSWFIGAYAGASLLGAKSGDTAKSGYTMGVKVGRSIELKNKTLSLAGGYLYNQMETRDRDNNLGAYEITTKALTAEAALHYAMSEKLKLGPKALILAGKDVSFSESQASQNVSAYLGADGLYNLSRNLDLEMNIQQRVDDWSRVNILGNLGLRVSF